MNIELKIVFVARKETRVIKPVGVLVFIMATIISVHRIVCMIGLIKIWNTH